LSSPPSPHSQKQAISTTGRRRGGKGTSAGRPPATSMDDVHRIVTRDAKQRLDLASHGQGCVNDHRAAAQLVGLGTVSSERVAQKAANHHQDGSPLRGRQPIFHTLSLLDATVVETRVATLLHFYSCSYCTIDRAEIQYPISCYPTLLSKVQTFITSYFSEIRAICPFVIFVTESCQAMKPTFRDATSSRDTGCPATSGLGNKEPPLGKRWLLRGERCRGMTGNLGRGARPLCQSAHGCAQPESWLYLAAPVECQPSILALTLAIA
jgi:hypothetical protein